MYIWIYSSSASILQCFYPFSSFSLYQSFLLFFSYFYNSHTSFRCVLLLGLGANLLLYLLHISLLQRERQVIIIYIISTSSSSSSSFFTCFIISYLLAILNYYNLRILLHTSCSPHQSSIRPCFHCFDRVKRFRS